MSFASQLSRLPISIGMLVTLGLFVFWRNLPTLPTVMQDEWVYLNQALKPISENEFGNFLHSLFYSTSLLFGSEFYVATKSMNTLWLLLWALAVLFIARKFLAGWVASLLAAGVLLGATGLYASVFMPEVMFFALASWALVVYVKAISSESNELFIWLSLAVFLLVLAGLTKPHAFILVFALGVYPLIAFATKRISLKQTLTFSGGTLFGYAILKPAFGFVLAGETGLTILGRNYEDSLSNFIGNLFAFSEGGLSASAGMPNPVDAVSLATVSLFVFVHFLLLLSVFGFMTLGLPVFLVRPVSKLSDYQVLVTVVSVVYLLAVASFTALVTYSGDDHSGRMLGRYFEFLVPFVFIAGLMEITKREKIAGGRKVLIFALFGILALSWLVIINRSEFQLADSALLLGAYRESIFPWMVVGVFLAIIFIVIDRPKMMMTWITIIIFASSSIIGLSAQQRQIDLNSEKVPADYAGIDLQTNFADLSGEELVILGTNKQLIDVPKFWGLKTDVESILLSQGSVIDTKDELLDKYSIIVQLPGIEVIGGEILSEGPGYRIIGTN